MSELRPLSETSWDQLAAAFEEAFSDYAVKMTMSPEALAAMQVRRGYDAAASYGAFDGERLVGFVLTCREVDRAYNSGTGVVPSHRRAGIARELVDAVIANVRPREYVLEVLEDNAPAIAFYCTAGFVETRRFQCWTYDGARANVPELVAPDLDAIAASADVELSWQNSLASIRRSPEPWLAIGDAHGAAVVFPASGDVPLLAVGRDARRRGIGTRLLAGAAAAAGRPLRLLNLDDRDPVIAQFLAAAGARPFVRQLEMVRRA